MKCQIAGLVQAVTLAFKDVAVLASSENEQTKSYCDNYYSTGTLVNKFLWKLQ